MSEESPSDDKNSEEINDDVHIISNNDERLKCLGKVLNNDSSMEILQLITQNEMTALEISEQTKQSLSLVIHHLNNMMQGGIVTITKTKPNTKNQLMKYYTAKSGIFILPENAAKKAKNSKTFTNSLKRVMKFTGIGFGGIASWFMIKNLNTDVNDDGKTVHLPFTEGESLGFIDLLYIYHETWIPIVVISAITLLSYFVTKKIKLKN